MNKPKLKLFGGMLILAVLGLLFGIFLLLMNIIVNGVYEMNSQAAKMQAINDSVENIVEIGSYVTMQKVDEFTKRVALASVASRGFIHDDWDGKPTSYSNGAIVTVSGDEVRYPDDYPEELKIGADSLTEKFGIVHLVAEDPDWTQVHGGIKTQDERETKNEIEAQDEADTQGEAKAQDGADTQDEAKAQGEAKAQDDADTQDDADIQDGKERQNGDRNQPDHYLVEYSRVDDGIYYVESERFSNLEERASHSYDMNSSLKSIETAFGVWVMLISGAENENGMHPLVYISESLGDEGGTAEEYGITDDMLEKAIDSKSSVTTDVLSEHLGTVKMGGDECSLYIQNVQDTDGLQDYLGDGSSQTGVYLAYLVPGAQSARMTYEQTSVVIVVFFMIGIVLLVWFFSVFRLVRQYRLDEEQAEGFRLGRMIRKSFSMIGIGCCIIVVVAALFLSLFRLYSVCNTVEKSLKVLERRIKENAKQKKTTVEEMKDTYAEYAKVIAQVLTDRPDFATAETLKEFSELIGADYIMVFDHDGKELLTDSQYVEMVLGTSPDSPTYEFRRLLKGIPVVKHDVLTDEETGLTNAMIGVCLKSKVFPEDYGALIVAVPKEKLTSDSLESTDDVMKSLVSEGSFAFSVDPETQMIVSASESSLIGRNAVSLGLSKEALTDSYRDFFAFNGSSCYGESKAIDGKVYYYAAEQSHIYRNVLIYAAIAAAAGFVLLSVLILFMLFGYRKRFDYWVEQGSELESPLAVGNEPEDEMEFMKNPRQKWEKSFSNYGVRTPMRNATGTLEILLVIADVFLAIRLLMSDKANGSLLSFVMYGHWTKGFNLFSFTSILIMFAEMVIVVSILKIIIRVVCAPLGSKGETFFRLAQNLLTYGGVIVFIYLTFYNLGFNLGPLLASLSLPAFALSLGAKDLITDIVAGISIVFEGEYKVGDIIEVNGYRGKVLEIGVRTTKLQGSGNNIKIIYNRDVKNVLNMTRENSWYTLEVKVSSEHGVKEIESILNEQLPVIGQSIPNIISGPHYRGITEIGPGCVTLLIVAECEEENYKKVQREMNHAIQDLFDRFEIKLVK